MSSDRFLKEKALDASSSMTLFEGFPYNVLSIIDGGETTLAADVASSSIDVSSKTTTLKADAPSATLVGGSTTPQNFASSSIKPKMRLQ